MSDRPAWTPHVVLAVASLDSLSVRFLPGWGGGGYSTDAWVGRCGPGVQTLTLFKTQFSDSKFSDPI